jgi:hypothetical protein
MTKQEFSALGLDKGDKVMLVGKTLVSTPTEAVIQYVHDCPNCTMKSEIGVTVAFGTDVLYVRNTDLEPFPTREAILIVPSIDA